MKATNLLIFTTAFTYTLAALYFGFTAPVTMFFCYALIVIFLLIFGEQLMIQLVIRPILLFVNLLNRSH